MNRSEMDKYYNKEMEECRRMLVLLLDDYGEKSAEFIEDFNRFYDLFNINEKYKHIEASLALSSMLGQNLRDIYENDPEAGWTVAKCVFHLIMDIILLDKIYEEEHGGKTD